MSDHELDALAHAWDRAIANLQAAYRDRASVRALKVPNPSEDARASRRVGRALDAEVRAMVAYRTRCERRIEEMPTSGSV